MACDFHMNTHTRAQSHDDACKTRAYTDVQYTRIRPLISVSLRACVCVCVCVGGSVCVSVCH